MQDATDNIEPYYKIFIVGSLPTFNCEEFEKNIKEQFVDFFKNYFPFSNNNSIIVNSSLSKLYSKILKINHNLKDDLNDYAGASVIILLIDEYFRDNKYISILDKLTIENIPLITITDNIRKYSEYTSFNERIQLVNAIDTKNKEDLSLLPSIVLTALGLEDRYRKVFISYARADKTKLAYTLFSELRKYRYEVFLDFISIDKGVSFQEELKQQLCDSDVIIMLDSEHYRDRKWVDEEVQLAFKRNIPMLRVKSDLKTDDSLDQDQKCVFANGFQELVDYITIDYKKEPNEASFEPSAIYENSEDVCCNIDKNDITRIVHACERLRSLGYARRSQAIFSAGFSYLKTVELPKLNKAKGSVEFKFYYQHLLLNFSKRVAVCITPLIKIPKFSNLIYEFKVNRALFDEHNILRRHLLLFDNFGLNKEYDNAFLTNYYYRYTASKKDKATVSSHKTAKHREKNCRVLVYPVDDILSHKRHLPFLRKSSAPATALVQSSPVLNNEQLSVAQCPNTQCSGAQQGSAENTSDEMITEIPTQRLGNEATAFKSTSQDLPLLFLSAGLPMICEPLKNLDTQDQKFAGTIDNYLVLFAIRELLKVCVNRYKIIFGGHPLISYLIADTIQKLELDRPLNELITVYQSTWFQKNYPKINEFYKAYAAIIHTPAYSSYENLSYLKSFSRNPKELASADEKNREISLEIMRHIMIDENVFSKAVFIGGKKGVKEEFGLLINSMESYQSPCEIILLSAPGGIAATLEKPLSFKKSHHKFCTYDGFNFGQIFGSHLYHCHDDGYENSSMRHEEQGMFQNDIPRDTSNDLKTNEPNKNQIPKTDPFLKQLHRLLK